MRGHDREQDQAGGRHEGAGHRRGRARGPVPEALVEQRDADRRRDHRVDHRHGGQRRGQPGAPVGRLRQQQPGGRQRRDRREVGPQPAQRTGGEAFGHRLGEHGGHAEGGTGGRGQQHAVQHRPAHPVRRHEQHGHRRPGHRQQHAPLTARQGLLRPAVPAGQRQQPGQAHRGQHRPAPGRRARPAPYEDGRHRQGEDDGERTQRLHQAQGSVREGHHVQQCAQAVQPHRHPPAAPPQRGVRAVRRARRDPFLDDRATRVGQGGHETEQDRQRQCTHKVHNARPICAIPPPTGGHRSYSRRSTGVRQRGPYGSGRRPLRCPATTTADPLSDRPLSVREDSRSGFGSRRVGSVQFPF